MKKSIIASLFAIVLLSACKETETTTVDITGTGTITGTVYADTDQVNSPFDSEVLPGVNVRILWQSDDLGVVSDGDGRTESLIVTTDSAGVYTAEVPTIEDGIEFEIVFDEIELDVTYNNGIADVTETFLFDGDDYTLTVRSEETRTRNHDYGSAATTSFEGFATISGVVEVDSEQINTEDIPELAGGATVTAKWEDNDGNERSLSTTSDASGNYSIQVPTDDVNGGFDVVFEDFTTAVDYNDGFRDVTGFSTKFDETEYNIGALDAGDEETQNHNYGSAPEEALPTFGLIQGNVEARVNAIAGQEDDNPVAGLEVRITWTDDEGNTRGIFVTTDAQGDYSTEVPLADTDDFSIRFAEFTVSPYAYNNGMADITDATATYAEFNTSANNVGKGEERTVDRSNTTPASIED